MFNMLEVREMIRLMEQNSLREIVITEGDSHIALRRDGGSVITGTAPIPQPIKFAPVAAASLAPAASPKSVMPAAQTQAVPPAQVSVEPSLKAVSHDPTLHKIVSPMVGTFYRAPAPDAPPYVKVGDKVTKSTIVCIVEAMKLFNEIEAEVEGEVVEILAENEKLVHPGQTMFLIKTN